MEKWESLLDQYAAPDDMKTLETVIQTAQAVLADDLAPFEIDWFLESLLLNPVALLEKVSSQRAEDAWSKLLISAFTLLADIVKKFDKTAPYYEDIEQLCELSYAARVRARALACLSQLARRRGPRAGADAARAHELALSLDNTCQAARCELLGVLCEHHPELFPDVTTLWRTFLNMLDSHTRNSKKMSADLLKEVLLAVSRLLRHFGADLVVSEVYSFYDMMKASIKTPKCHEVCCSILENYSELFKEKLSADGRLRAQLWDTLGHASRPALLAVYRTCFEHGQHSQTLVAELESRCLSERPLTRFTALRALGAGGRAAGRAAARAHDHADVQLLERRLRERRAHEHLEEISWCISAGVLHAERLLQAAILCGDALPAAAVARHILDAPADMRTPAIVFLTTETCAAPDDRRRELLLSIWSGLAGGGGGGADGSDVTVLEEYLQHAIFLIEKFMDDQPEELPPRLSALLELTAHVLETFAADVRAATCGALVRAARACVRAYGGAGAVRVLRAAATRGAALDDFYEGIDVASCEDEAQLLQTCRALLEAPPAAAATAAARRQLLRAATVLLSRSDTEPAVLSQAVNAIERLILTREEELDKQLLNEVIYLVEKIRQLNDGSSKDHRILHRVVVMFLGKFGGSESYNEVDRGDEASTTVLKELCLNLPTDGATLKLDLRDTLQHAVAAGDPDALHTLLAIICANSRGAGEPAAGGALCRVMAALSRRSARAARAAPLCGRRGVHRLLAYAAGERSPRARRTLLAAAGAALARGAQRDLAELAEELLALAEYQHNTSQAKLDLLSTLIGAMKDNNILSQNYLPRVLVLILKTHLLSTHKVFREAAQLLIGKIPLFGHEELETLIYSVLESLCEDNFEIDTKSKKIVAQAATFLKKLYDLKKEELPSVMEVFERATPAPLPRVLHTVSALKIAFECDLPFCRELVVARNSFFEEFFDLISDCSTVVDAILVFIAAFADVLLEVHYEKTLRKLSQVIENFTPDQIIYAHENLSLCMDAVTRCLARAPRALLASVGAWLSGPHVAGVARWVARGGGAGGARAAAALAHVVEVFGAGAAAGALRAAAGDWLRLARAGDGDAECLADLVQVCLAVLPPEGVRKVVCGENNDDKLKFCRTYISAFSKFFTRKPFVLLDEGWSELVGILDDVVHYTVTRRRGETGTLLELVDEVWPCYEARSELKQKVSLLRALSRLRPAPRPVRWLTGALAAPGTPPGDRVRLLAVLPAGDDYGSTYVTFASAWPARLRELRGLAACALRALLDAAARTADRAPLALLARLAAGDSTKGWWDEAFEDCMKEVAPVAQLDLLDHVYALSYGARSACACDRLLVPLLRYVTPSLCEEFFSFHLEELLSALRKKPREGATDVVRRSCVVDQTCAFNVLRIAFEKIPKQHIESPGSALYSRLPAAGPRPFHLVYEVCVCGAQLRAPPAAPAAPDDDTDRVFRCAVYNCMAAALCLRGPKPETFGAVFAGAVWGALVDDRVQYNLPIVEGWKQHTTTQAVSIDVSAGARSAPSAGATSRTAHFLRTLSEDPFLYDIPEPEDASARPELELEDNPLNRHECAATLTALVRHVAAAAPAPGAAPGPAPWLGWRNALRSALQVDGNASWLLAQVVCNCTRELRAHAAALRPALLALVARAPALNGLHLDILNTVVQWGEAEGEGAEVSAEHVTAAVRALVLAAGAGARGAGAVLQRLHQLTELYGRRVALLGDCATSDSIRTLLTTIDGNNRLGLKILRILAKNKVELHALAEPLLEAALRAGAPGAAGAAGAALALAAGALPAARAAPLAARLRLELARLRRQRQLDQYVRLLYYTQRGWPACCDIDTVRDVADLANKIPGGGKQKCLDIVATYLAHASKGEHVDELFDTLDISQLVAAGEGLAVAERGLPLMAESLRRRVAAQLAEGARPQVLTALEVALSLSEPEEPAAKRRRVGSALLSPELRPLVAAAARLITDETVPRVAALLSSDLAVRFCEAFALAVYHPLTSRGGAGGAAGGAHRLLELFLHGVRAHDRFRSARLSDEPLDLGDPPQPSSAPLTPAGPAGAGQLAADAAGDGPIDVQMPLDDVLSSVLRFAKRRPMLASELCVQLCSAAYGMTSGAAGGAGAAGELCALLAELVRPPPAAPPAPLVLQLCRLHVDGCCARPGFPAAVERLAAAARAREHGGVTRALRQEVRLRTCGARLFVMGSPPRERDPGLPPVTSVFDIDGLVSSFGEVSPGGGRAAAGALPALWTDCDTFRASLDGYQGEGWFGALLAVYRGGPAPPRLLHRLDRWPRDHFQVSAVVEALEWRYLREESRSQADLHKLTVHIQPGDCLAEWAARLMLRRLFLKSLEEQSESESSDKSEERSAERALSRSHQLRWCARANEMELPALALQCLEDVPELYESETMQWLEQKMLALRTLGLQRGQRDKLQEALQLYEAAARFRAAAPLRHALAVEHCRLLLLRDVGDLSPERMSTVLEVLQSEDTLSGRAPTDTLRDVLRGVFAVVVQCLYEHCGEDLSLLRVMCNLVRVHAALALGRGPGFADMLLHRVVEREGPLPEGDVDAVLAALEAVRAQLDEGALELLRAHAGAFPARARCAPLLAPDAALRRARDMLALVAEPAHCLLHYCEGLLRAARDHDAAAWRRTFASMRAKLFDNPFAGPDYRVLEPHGRALRHMEGTDIDGAAWAARAEELARLLGGLRGARAERAELSLPQLCPALCAAPAAPALLRLLRLPAGATAHFHETVHVYTTSLRRPVRLAVRVTGGGGAGGVRRYIVKSGEALRTDAAALRWRAALADAVGGAAEGGYWVTPLSEDCGLIQYVEETDTVRALILQSTDSAAGGGGGGGSGGGGRGLRGASGERRAAVPGELRPGARYAAEVRHGAEQLVRGGLHPQEGDVHALAGLRDPRQLAAGRGRPAPGERAVRARDGRAVRRGLGRGGAARARAARRAALAQPARRRRPGRVGGRAAGGGAGGACARARAGGRGQGLLQLAGRLRPHGGGNARAAPRRGAAAPRDGGGAAGAPPPPPPAAPAAAGRRVPRLRGQARLHRGGAGGGPAAAVHRPARAERHAARLGALAVSAGALEPAPARVYWTN